MSDLTMRERVARAIGQAREQFQLCDGFRHDNYQVWHIERHEPVFIGKRSACLAYIDGRCANAAMAEMREPTSAMAIAHQVGFCRTWTDPWDCLGPEQEEALGLHVAGEDMFDAAHERLDEYMLEAWHGAIDAALAEKSDGE